MKVEIDVPEGCEIEAVTFRQKLPTTWEGLGTIKGYHVSITSGVVGDDNRTATISNRKLFATEQQAKAAIALAQLSQLKKVYNGDWEADWGNDEEKWCILPILINRYVVSTQRTANVFLSFKDEQTARLFLECFKDLIDQARPLLS